MLSAMVYADPKAVGFFDDVSNYLDNHALHHTFLAKNDARFFDIAQTGWLDWTFNSIATVWTAKGKSKRRNLTYVRPRLRLEGRGLLV